VRVAIGLLVLAGCGRIGFDAGSDFGSDGRVTGDGSTSDVPAGAPFTLELPAQSTISDIAGVPNGIVAVGGRVGSLTLDGITDLGVGGADIVIVALDGDGHARWLHQHGGTANDLGMAVAVAPDGSIYVGGYVESAASLGGPTRVGSGRDAFVAKYTPAGDYVWDIRFGGLESSDDFSDMVLDLAVRSDGDLFVAGRVAGTVDFGLGNTSASSAGSDAFVARYSPSGALRWARRFGEEGLNAFSGIAVSNDTVYVGGFYTGAPNFGTGNLPARGASDAVILRMDAETTAVSWVANFGGDDNQYIYSVELHGNTIVGAGYFWQTIDLPNISTPAQRADGLVVEYDTLTGAFVDAYRYGGPGCDYLYSAKASNGQIVASGAFQDTVVLDTDVTAAGLSDGVVVGLDSSGVQWHRTFGNDGDEVAQSTIGDVSSALFVGGTRDVRLDAGCYPTPGVTTGYIRRF